MRYVNRALSFLAGVALLGVGALGAIEAVSTGLGDGFVWIPGHTWIHTLRTTDWSGTPATLTFAGIAAAGVVLLVAELWRRPRTTLELSLDDFPEGQHWIVQRRSLQSRVAHDVMATTTCPRIRAALRYRNRAWHLVLTGTGSPAARPEVERAARESLRALGAPQPADVRIRLRPVPIPRAS